MVHREIGCERARVVGLVILPPSPLPRLLSTLTYTNPANKRAILLTPPRAPAHRALAHNGR